MISLTKNREVSYQRLDFRRKEFTTCRTGQDVGSSQVHEADLAEGVPARQDARYLVLVVVLIVANWTIAIHNSKFIRLNNN